MLLVLTMLLTVPLGLGVGIYLSEFAGESRISRIIRICIETLASMPSIVIGIFGLMLFVTILKWGFSVLSGVMALTVLNLPVMTRIAEDAIRNVGKDLREASLALGATQWQTITNVVLVAAIPGLVTGIILSSGRVFGEAAALLYTAGMTTPALHFNDAQPLQQQLSFLPVQAGGNIGRPYLEGQQRGPESRRQADSQWGVGRPGHHGPALQPALPVDGQMDF